MDTFVRLDSVISEVKKVPSDRSRDIGNMNFHQRPFRQGKWSMTYEHQKNTTQDVAGNLNLASDRLEVRHYSVPATSSSIAIITTVVFASTAVVATLLTVSTSSLVASGVISRPSSYMISEPSRNLLRMACHIQMFALSRWLSINLPIEYYEFAKGIEWSIPYIHLPWEGPSADPFVGYSTMPAIAYSELLERSAVGADISYPRAQGQQMPMQTPIGWKPVIPMQIPLDGKPLTAMEYRTFFENQDMKPEAQIIMKLQDLDGWKYFGRNMFWLGVIGGGLILLHVVVLLYFKLRYRSTEKLQNYGALAFPRLEIMLVILAMPCSTDQRWDYRRARCRDRADRHPDVVPGGPASVPVAGHHDGPGAPVQGGAPGGAGVPLVPGDHQADARPRQARAVDVEGRRPRRVPREARPAVRGPARPAQVHAHADSRRRRREARGSGADHGVGGRERGRGGAVCPEGVRHPEDILHVPRVGEARGTGHRGGRARVVGTVVACAHGGGAGHRVVPALLHGAQEALHQEAGAAGGDRRGGQRGVHLRRLPRAHRQERRRGGERRRGARDARRVRVRVRGAGVQRVERAVPAGAVPEPGQELLRGGRQGGVRGAAGGGGALVGAG